MSRLDSVIRRLRAQRDCIDFAAGAIAGTPGPVLELGLGNGRTYDHLRDRLPDREIFVFERQVNAHPDCIPDDAHLFLGDILDTLPRAIARLGRVAALAHSDIGTGDAAANAALVAKIAPQLARLLCAGALVLSDQKFSVEGWEQMALPEGVPTDRYFLYRVTS